MKNIKSVQIPSTNNTKMTKITYSLVPIEQPDGQNHYEVCIRGSFVNPTFEVYRLHLENEDMCMQSAQEILQLLDIAEIKKTTASFVPTSQREIDFSKANKMFVYVTFHDK